MWYIIKYVLTVLLACAAIYLAYTVGHWGELALNLEGVE